MRRFSARSSDCCHAPAAVLLGLCCSGCATIALWEETEKVKVEIHDVRVVETNGVAESVIISGRKQPFLWFSTKGEFDSFDVFAPANGKWTCIASPECPVAANAICRLPLVKAEIGSAPDLRCPEGVFMAWNRMHDIVLVVPVDGTSGSSASGSRQESVMVLKKPHIWHDRESREKTPCYTREELGIRGVVQRIFFVPVTVCVDVITLPVALIVGPCMKMCN